MIQFQPFLLLLLEWDLHVCLNTQRELSWGISHALTTPHPQNEEGKTHVPEACFCFPGNCNLQLKIEGKSCIIRENLFNFTRNYFFLPERICQKAIFNIKKRIKSVSILHKEILRVVAWNQG